ncbi:MAG: hypothetical protein K6F68_09020 [Clostridiales bacterium]|nr:hypothetical protein [Clostridiales bacterium]
MNKRDKNKALKVAFCGITAALGAGVMLAGGLFGVMTYAAPLIAALFLIPVDREFGGGAAMLAYLATAVVTALLSPDKELAFFYAFIGYYPVLKRLIDRLPLRLVRFIIKLVFFASSLAVMYLALIFLFKLPAVLGEIEESGLVLWLALDSALLLILMLWDVIVRLTRIFYELKLRPKLKFVK